MKTLLVCAVLVLGFETASAQQPQRIELMPYLHEATFVPNLNSYSTSESVVMDDDYGRSVEIRFYEAGIYTETGELITSEWWLSQDPRAKYLVEIDVTTSGAMSQNFVDASAYIFGWAVGACFAKTVPQAEFEVLSTKIQTGMDTAFSQGQGTFTYATESVSWLLELTYYLDGFHSLRQVFRFADSREKTKPRCILEKVDPDY